VIASGGTIGVTHDDGSGAADAGGSPDATAPPDAEIADAASEPFAGPPKSCEDVGKLPGYNSCCLGKYCAGACMSGKECRCGTLIGGCIWPEVCCGGICVGVNNVACKEK
jgi:hypothetical protein